MIFNIKLYSHGQATDIGHTLVPGACDLKQRLQNGGIPFNKFCLVRTGQGCSRLTELHSKRRKSAKKISQTYITGDNATSMTPIRRGGKNKIQGQDSNPGRAPSTGTQKGVTHACYHYTTLASLFLVWKHQPQMLKTAVAR